MPPLSLGVPVWEHMGLLLSHPVSEESNKAWMLHTDGEDPEPLASLFWGRGGGQGG